MTTSPDDGLFPTLRAYVADCIGGFDRVGIERRDALERLAEYVRDRIERDGQARLIFICTHNSRRSHLAQVWAAAAAAHYRIGRVQTYSGGTEATAFDPRAVAALARAGFSVHRMTEGANPVYEVRGGESGPVVEAFSKVYDQPPNPTGGFCAVMTCSDADRDCPLVRGAELRVALPYVDPKLSDGTDRETTTYDERCARIGTEMLYLFSRLREP